MQLNIDANEIRPIVESVVAELLERFNGDNRIAYDEEEAQIQGAEGGQSQRSVVKRSAPHADPKSRRREEQGHGAHERAQAP